MSSDEEIAPVAVTTDRKEEIEFLRCRVLQPSRQFDPQFSVNIAGDPFFCHEVTPSLINDAYFDQMTVSMRRKLLLLLLPPIGNRK